MTPATLAAPVAAIEAVPASVDSINTQDFEDIDNMLLHEVDVTGYEAVPAASARAAKVPSSSSLKPTFRVNNQRQPAAAASARSVQSSASMANGILPAATQATSANSSAISQLPAKRKRGRPPGSKNKEQWGEEGSEGLI